MKDKIIERRGFLKLTATAAIAPGVLASTASSAKAEKQLVRAEPDAARFIIYSFIRVRSC